MRSSQSAPSVRYACVSVEDDSCAGALHSSRARSVASTADGGPQSHKERNRRQTPLCRSRETPSLASNRDGRAGVSGAPSTRVQRRGGGARAERINGMRDRVLQIFQLPSELRELVGPVAVQAGLWLVADGLLRGTRVWNVGATPGEFPDVDDAFSGHVLLARDRPPASRLTDGLASSTVRIAWPTLVDGTLQLSQHDTRTSDDEVWRIADRLFRRMRKRSRRPVWAWQRDDPATARPYRTISIAPAAEAWWRSGGALNQLGVDQVQFAPEPPK